VPLPPVARLGLTRSATSALRWQAVDAWPQLGADEAHLWLVDLDAAGGEPADVLSPDERRRAEAFVRKRDGRRFAACHAHLREILAGYVGADPAALALVEGPNGKPTLSARGPCFNLAHCEGVALCAVARRAVGVDLELVERPRRPRWEAVAERHFHEEELRALREAPGWSEFLRIWTLKEACLKAAGFGLTIDPRGFSVAAVLAGWARSVRLEGRDWRCVGLEPAPGTVAALASESAASEG
jgi:4'-phosphopantetheinyl transferase